MRNITVLTLLFALFLTPAFAADQVLTTPYEEEVARGVYGYGLDVRDLCANLTLNGLATTPEAFPKEIGVYTFNTTAATVEVSSSSTDDDAAGTGALTVVIEGLDSSYVFQTETLTMDGQAAQASGNWPTGCHSTKSFLRINRAYVSTSGTGKVNAGDIYIHSDHTGVSSGVPADTTKIYAVIPAGAGESQGCVYTTPLGYKAVLNGLDIYTDVGTQSVTIYTYDPTLGTVFYPQFVATTTPMHYPILVPIAEKNHMFIQLGSGASKRVFVKSRLVSKKHQ